LDFSNPITEILIQKRWTIERATREIYRKNKKEFEMRGVVWTPQWFNLVKLGYDEAKWLRKMIAEFFGIDENLISRKDKRTKRARDLSHCTNRVTSSVTVIIDYEWDIQLQVTRGSDETTKMKLGYIKLL